MNWTRFQGARMCVCNTAVVGSGAAGFGAADRLWSLGQRDIALVTEQVEMGTSRNTGSDKQTYYKLTLAGGEADSVREMAQTLFDGQCTDGDTALCEAALSAQGFLRLAELGVPFPRNRWGEYVGYKTDHDPRRRATSAGPYTSRLMTESLERAVREKGVPILDHLQAVRVLSDGARCLGLLCLDNARAGEEDERFVLVRCKNVVFATGGPAGMYADSVYPLGHCGAAGLAFEAGVRGQNLTEWQYGMASLAPRWNVSGSYMQALPRFISTRADGADEREFLPAYFANDGEMLTRVFLKGYQWPFDVRKVAGGSSIIDILVYLERCAGRRVFLDYRTNPGGRDVDFAALSEEARSYLAAAGACFGRPIDRLRRLNQPAVDFYRDKGVDLAAQPLEIAVCAQHNNGGLAVDAWWRTNLEGFFAAGEAAGTHGVYRPGGTALNAGQVGALRAAQYIAARRQGPPEHDEAFARAASGALEMARGLAGAALRGEGGEDVREMWRAAAARMSRVGAMVRDAAAIAPAAEALRREMDAFAQTVRAESPAHLRRVFRLRQTLLSQYVYLRAMLDYAQSGGKSRGSALYTDAAGEKPCAYLPDAFTFALEDGGRGRLVQEVAWHGGACRFTWRPVRPIPEEDDFFENVWRAYRENGNIDA